MFRKISQIIIKPEKYLKISRFSNTLCTTNPANPPIVTIIRTKSSTSSSTDNSQKRKSDSDEVNTVIKSSKDNNRPKKKAADNDRRNINKMTSKFSQHQSEVSFYDDSVNNCYCKHKIKDQRTSNCSTEDNKMK
jgi:hypothetical protein